MPEKVLNITETAFVTSAYPNVNFSTNPVIYTGSDETFQNTISFMKFTLPSLPVTKVDRAILQLTLITKSGTDASPVVINRLTSPLDTNTVTYETRSAFIPTIFKSDITKEDLYTTIKFDITELVNRWMDKTYPNYGIALTNAYNTTVVGLGSEKILYKPFYPSLILTYTGTTE